MKKMSIVRTGRERMKREKAREEAIEKLKLNRASLCRKVSCQFGMDW